MPKYFIPERSEHLQLSAHNVAGFGHLSCRTYGQQLCVRQRDRRRVVAPLAILLLLLLRFILMRVFATSAWPKTACSEQASMSLCRSLMNVSTSGVYAPSLIAFPFCLVMLRCTAHLQGLLVKNPFCLWALPSPFVEHDGT